ncbi:type III-A CRISPR-associated protein Cas10/Csm1 [Thermosyntropha sp.]|uniref:type III-A CRISPR-associated protein Cas10/Csm1 n=1 Tax=Thermosyntropha sp. TaxID=2740820 RepID=UPI00344B412C|nr:type III-A CRISPR-associated protein Cas10/Csm1 [Thermosyntropha sp.]
MSNKLHTITLGALLHDIGKIVYRAEGSSISHAETGKEFLSNENIKIPDKDTVLQIVRFHHKSGLKKQNLPSSHPVYLVYEADNIASALDRRDDEESSTEQVFEHYTPLESVFNLIWGRKTGQKGKYPASTLRVEDNIPFPEENRTNLTKGDYSRIKSHLEENLKKIDYQLENPNSVLKLLEATASFIPSSTYLKEIPDISLFDHSKITAAVASSLFLYLDEKNETDYKTIFFKNYEQFRKEEVFLLVLGDISGIQDFIYTISSKGALKSLRARSFYLDLICEHIADEILSALNLSRANLLYSGGGHFRLLLPNTEKTAAMLNLARENINWWLFKRYSTALYLEISSVPVSAYTLSGKQGTDGENLLKKAYEDLALKANQGKMRRFSGPLLEKIIFPRENSLDCRRECTICRTSSTDLIEDPFNPGSIICKNCLALRNIGGKLGTEKDNIIIAVTRSHSEKNASNTLEIPGISGENLYLSFLSETQTREELAKNPDNIKRLYSINRLYTGVGYSTNLWAGNYSREPELKEEGYIDFNELAKASCGIKRLGVLRADVDNLGLVFAEGFKQGDEKSDPYKYLSLSRSAALSRQMSMFFKYYINHICRRKERNKNRIYLTPESRADKNLALVYSGGDDLFIVGAWNEIIDFALDLREAFEHYTMGRLTFSAGIGLFRPGFPISQMAAFTGDLEKEAKKNKTSPGEKNSLALFGMEYDKEAKEIFPHVYPWDEFRDKVLSEKYRFLAETLYMEDKTAPPGMIKAGMSLCYRWLNLLRNLGDDRERINLARLAYNLARLEPPASAPEETRAAYETLRKKLYMWASSDKDRRQLITALTLFIYLNRKEKEDEADDQNLSGNP